MTNVEILQAINTEQNPLYWTKQEQNAAINEAVEAIEKQTPKQPQNIKSIKFTGSIREQFKKGACPCCGCAVDTDDDLRFCSECGQRLDW